MKLFLPAPRATALIPSDDNGDTKHLFVVLTSPQGEDGELLIVNISSIHEGIFHDPSCILDKDDHDFVKHPSYVVYRKAEIVPARALLDAVQRGDNIPCGTVTDEVYARICEGLRRSRFTSPKVARFFEKATNAT